MAHIITSSQAEVPLAKCLTILRNACQYTQFRPHSFMIDKSPTEIAAIRTVYGPAMSIRICYFHVTQALERWLKLVKSNTPKSFHSHIHAAFALMVHCHDKIALQQHVAAFETYMDENHLVTFKAYWLKDWKACIDMWSLAGLDEGRRYFLIKTNNHTEAFYRLLKYMFLKQKRNRRVDSLIDMIINDVSQYYRMFLQQVAVNRIPLPKLNKQLSLRMERSRTIAPATKFFTNSQTDHSFVSGFFQSSTANNDANNTQSYLTIVSYGGCFCSCPDTFAFMCKHCFRLKDMSGKEWSDFGLTNTSPRQKYSSAALNLIKFLIFSESHEMRELIVGAISENISHPHATNITEFDSMTSNFPPTVSSAIISSVGAVGMDLESKSESEPVSVISTAAVDITGSASMSAEAGVNEYVAIHNRLPVAERAIFLQRVTQLNSHSITNRTTTIRSRHETMSNLSAIGQASATGIQFARHREVGRKAKAPSFSASNLLRPALSSSLTMAELLRTPVLADSVSGNGNDSSESIIDEADDEISNNNKKQKQKSSRSHRF